MSTGGTGGPLPGPRLPGLRSDGPPALTALLGDLADVATSSHADVVIAEIIRHLEPLTRRLAVAIATKLDPDHDCSVEDFARCIRIEANKLLRRIAGDPQALAEIGSLQAVLSWRGRAAAATWWARRGPHRLLAAQASRARRLAEVDRTRSLLAAEGNADPSPRELLQRHTARLRAVRSDTERQRMLAAAASALPRPSDRRTSTDPIAARLSR